MFERLNPSKSSWVPSEGEFASLDLFINKSRRDISNLKFNRKLSYSHLSKEEWTAVRNLRNRTDVFCRIPYKRSTSVETIRRGVFSNQQLYSRLAILKLLLQSN